MSADERKPDDNTCLCGGTLLERDSSEFLECIDCGDTYPR